jgi:hypothetical protein
MRRHAMGLAFFFAVGVSVSLASLSAEGQQPAAKPAASAAAKPAASAAAAKDAGAPSTTAAGASTPDGGATPATTAAPAGSGPAVPIPDKPAMDGATYGVRLRDLEARVDELKDQIRRSHTRLALLSDTILSGGAAGSRAEIVFKNEMSSAFRLIQALVVVDGAVQYNRADESGALADQKEIPIFNGSIPPGDHTVQVKLKFQGNGYGVFTYLRGYKFDVQSAHQWTAVEGKTIGLVATALEKGGVTTPLEQRPTVEWQEKIGALGAGMPQPAPAAPAGGANGNVQTTPNGGSAGGSINIGGGK